MPQLIQVRPSKVVCKGPVHQDLPVKWGHSGAAVCAPSQQPLDILMGFLMGHSLYRLSWQAQGQSPAGISDGASSHSQPGGVCPQALHLPAQHGVAGAMLASPGQTQWDGCCYAGVFRPCSLPPPIPGWLHRHLRGVPAPQLCPLKTPSRLIVPWACRLPRRLCRRCSTRRPAGTGWWLQLTSRRPTSPTCLLQSRAWGQLWPMQPPPLLAAAT